MKKAFIINGSGHAGKDSFVGFIQDEIDNVINISSVTEIKEIARDHFGWEGQKTNEWRRVLSDIKQIQSASCDGPLKYMMAEWEEGQDNDVFFFHVREPKEIKEMVALLGAKTVLITRATEGDHQIIFGNEADDGVLDYRYDIMIVNDTLARLKESALLFIEEFIKDV